MNRGGDASLLTAFRCSAAASSEASRAGFDQGPEQHLAFCSSGLYVPHAYGTRRRPGRHARDGASSRQPQPLFELAHSSSCERNLSAGRLLVQRPVAVLHLIPPPAVLFVAGALAGAIGKTITAPLDRVKILLQVKGGMASKGVQEAAAGGGVLRSLVAIGKHEGIAGYWKGNLPQVVRVVPYSAAQLCSYELYKHIFRNEEGKLSVVARLGAGACAGMTATLLTYPLDTLRLRLAVDPGLRGMRAASAALFREGAYPAFFRGLGAALIGIAPYMALELASYDLLPREMLSFARGFSAALIATSFCYPLDTIRRQIQLSSTVRVSMGATLARTLEQEGVAGLYRGFIPNALKNLPNKGVRLSTFEAAKTLLAKAEQAYAEEERKYGAQSQRQPLQAVSHRI